MNGRTIVGVAGIATAAAVGISSAARRNDAGEITDAGSVSAFEVRVGDCFDDGAFENTEVQELPAVPCSQPHDNEIFATFNLQGEWPGAEGVEELAEDGCMERFAGAVGRSYEDSEIALTTIFPSEGSWSGRDDREVICVGFHMDLEKLTGSILHSGR